MNIAISCCGNDYVVTNRGLELHMRKNHQEQMNARGKKKKRDLSLMLRFLITK